MIPVTQVYASPHERLIFGKANYDIEERDPDYWEELNVLRTSTAKGTCDPLYNHPDGESFSILLPKIESTSDLLNHRVIIYARDEDRFDIDTTIATVEGIFESIKRSAGSGGGGGGGKLAAAVEGVWGDLWYELDKLGWKEHAQASVESEEDATWYIAPWADVPFFLENHGKSFGAIDLLEGRDYWVYAPHDEGGETGRAD